jgi:hypothetical protein
MRQQMELFVEYHSFNFQVGLPHQKNPYNPMEKDKFRQKIKKVILHFIKEKS